jgi:hypothetical protein
MMCRGADIELPEMGSTGHAPQAAGGKHSNAEVSKMDKVPHIIPDILEKIVAGYAPRKVILFGSYAYGEPDEDSDIDLLIIKDTNEPPIRS